jgi:hypothetical protein
MTKVIMCISILLIAIPSTIFAVEQPKKGTADQEIVKDYQLIADKCVSTVKTRLHDPSSAELPNALSVYDYPNKFYVGQRKKGIVTVQFEMRAKNAYNALRRLTAECQWKRDKDGYKLIKMRTF